MVRDIQVGFIRSKHGYRLYRAQAPRRFWLGTMVGIVGVIFFYGLSALLMVQAFSIGS
ncbi:MAG: hypothetical protein AAF821_18310 [Cyanobacteria bacterium P01_D01_bin.156]